MNYMTKKSPSCFCLLYDLLFAHNLHKFDMMCLGVVFCSYFLLQVFSISCFCTFLYLCVCVCVFTKHWNDWPLHLQIFLLYHFFLFILLLGLLILYNDLGMWVPEMLFSSEHFSQCSLEISTMFSIHWLASMPSPPCC